MKLEDYLKERSLTKKDFADLVGVSNPQIIRIINKTRNPSSHLMKRIEELTDGKVTMQDLFNPETPSRLRAIKIDRE